MGRLGLAILEAAERWWNELDGNGGREGELCWLNRWKMKPQNGGGDKEASGRVLEAMFMGTRTWGSDGGRQAEADGGSKSIER
jgi:hypothetical protein